MKRALDCCIVLVLFSFFLGCGEKEGDSSAHFVLNTPKFSEIQEMTAKVSASFDIAGKTCPLYIDPDFSLSGACAGLPTGNHSFTLSYVHSDQGVVIASASGSLILDTTSRTAIAPLTLNKTQDDDGDGHSNLVEVMFATDPKDAASTPPLPPFATRVSSPVGKDPKALKLGLLNGDADLDLVTANGGDGTVTVRLGNGDGSFQAASSYAAGASGGQVLNPSDLVLKDLNGDAVLDLIVMDAGEIGSGAGSVAVLLGNGDGSFQTALLSTVGDFPSDLALGDLNNDTVLDIVTGNFVSKTVSLLLGNGDGSFATASSLSAGISGDITALTLGDLDGDNNLDIIASLQTSQNLVVFLGRGDGTFREPVSRSLGLVISLALADIDGDATLDLVAALANSEIAVLVGNGNSSFQNPLFYKAGKTPGSLSIQDLDGDGNLDIVTENEKEGIVALLIGKSDGTFRSPVFFEVGETPSWHALGDLNRDGAFDLVSTDRATNSVTVLLSQ